MAVINRIFAGAYPGNGGEFCTRRTGSFRTAATGAGIAIDATVTPVLALGGVALGALDFAVFRGHSFACTTCTSNG